MTDDTRKAAEIRFCDDCRHLDPKESDQKKGESHWCRLSNEQVKHLGMHPRIPRPEWCEREADFKLGAKHGRKDALKWVVELMNKWGRYFMWPDLEKAIEEELKAGE